MHGAPVRSTTLPVRARVALRVIVAADTWIERRSLASCVPDTGRAVDVSHAENAEQLFRHAHQYAFLTVVLADAAVVMRLLRSGQWPALHDGRRLRWVVACSDADCAELMRQLPQGHAGDVAIGQDAPSIAAQLTRLTVPARGLPARQQQVLILIQQGMSNKQIAANMGVAMGTVKNHVSAVLRKLNVHSRTQAALRRFESGPGRSLTTRE